MKWALVFAMCFATCSQEHRQTHPKVAIDSFKNGRTKDLSQL